MKTQTIKDLMVDSFMPYSAHLVFHRALPLIDGFKPSQRRILYVMYKNGMTHNKPYTKCNSISGDVMKIHPHGSTYETLVRMSEGNEAFGVPFIDSKGNFGKIYSRDSKQASERYTDARLNKLASELFVGINKDAVKMIETYDEKGKEPLILPVPYPTILTNGISGMAVGMATDFPIFNFHEVLNYTVAMLAGKEKSILDYIPSPDFPTDSSIIYDKDEMFKIMETGRGSFKIRAQYKIEDNSIHFIHVPYTTRYEVILDQVAELSKEGKLKEVVDAHDLYGMNSTGIQIIAKKGTDMEKLVEKLFSLTKLEDTYSANLNLVVDNVPQVLGVTEVIEEWIRFRKTTLKRMTNFQLQENLQSLEKLLGLKSILDKLDKVVSLIRKTKTEKLTSVLQSEFELTEIQAAYIQGIQLKNLSEDYILKRLDEIESLMKHNSTLEKLLNDEKAMNNYIIAQLNKLNKEYSFPRRTLLIDKGEVIKKSAKINSSLTEPEDYNLKVFVTEDLYLKKIPLTSMRGKFTNRLKEDDSFTIEQELTNTGEIIVFTDKYNVYKKRLSDIADNRPSDLGEYIPSLFDYEKDEKPLFAVPLNKEFNQTLVLGFNDGTVAKINTSAYYTKQNRQLLKKGYANKNLIYVSYGEGLEHLQANSSDGYTVVREMSAFGVKDGRSSNGNNFMKLNDDVNVVEYSVPTEEQIEKYLIKTAGRGKK